LSILVALNHVTHYRYDRRVALGPQIVRLRPAAHSRTRILSYSLQAQPTKHFINWQQDPQSNYLARLVFLEPTTEFRIEIDLIAEMVVLNPFDFFLENYAEQFPFDYEAAEKKQLAPYLIAQPASPLFAEYLRTIPRNRTRTIDFYLIRLEPGVQTPEKTLLGASGSCRDSAWLLAQLLRHLGFATRFVSGYLIQLTSAEESCGAPSDSANLHAWCEVFLPGAGWIGLDPTSGLLPGEGHIPLASASEPSSAAPLTGAVDVSEAELSHSMKVERIEESVARMNL
jgi:transglutaminase-like putative cysteine protease